MAEKKGPNPPNPARRTLPNGSQGPLGPGGRHGYLKPGRREDASKRQEARDKRSPQEQIALLDKRLGKGVGAQRERAKLEAQIAESSK